MFNATHKADYSKRLNASSNVIYTIKNSRAKRDVLKLHRASRGLYSQLDQELVICRQKQHHTTRYIELATQLEEACARVEKLTTFALLLPERSPDN